MKNINQSIKIPLVTCEKFMFPFAAFGLTQLSEEQKEIAAEMTKLFMNVTSQADIPVTKNKRFKVWINFWQAEKIGFSPDVALMSWAGTVYKNYTEDTLKLMVEGTHSIGRNVKLRINNQQKTSHEKIPQDYLACDNNNGGPVFILL